MNADIFAEVLYYVFNKSLEDEFPSVMNLANVTPVHKKVANMIKVIIDLLAFCLTYQKSSKDVHTSKLLIFLIPLCPNINAVSGKDMVRCTI